MTDLLTHFSLLFLCSFIFFHASSSFHLHLWCLFLFNQTYFPRCRRQHFDLHHIFLHPVDELACFQSPLRWHSCITTETQSEFIIIICLIDDVFNKIYKDYMKWALQTHSAVKHAILLAVFIVPQGESGLKQSINVHRGWTWAWWWCLSVLWL